MSRTPRRPSKTHVAPKAGKPRSTSNAEFPRSAPLTEDIATRAAFLLGGSRLLRVKTGDDMGWVRAIRAGFPSRVLDSLRSNIGVTKPELAVVLGISVRALAWRRRKGALSPVESNRLLRLAFAIARVEEAFGDLATGYTWLNEPNISLGGHTPISLLDTEIGSRIVLAILASIEHGGCA